MRPAGLLPYLQIILLRRVAGEVGNDRMGILQIEHLENGIRGFSILPLDDGVLDAHLLGGHVIFKDRLAVQTNPRIGRTGNRDFNIGIGLHVLVDILGVVGTEPQLAVHLAGKHEGAALGLAVTAHSGQILYGIFLQKGYDFIHDKYLLVLNVTFGIAIFTLQDYHTFISIDCKVSTLLCRSYQKETIERCDTMQQVKELPACPVETTLMLIGDKWKVLILRDLMPGTKRFGELKKSIGSVSQKVLTAQLRDMEEKGLVSRKVYAEVPPRVEYSLTELGKSLKPILDAMWTWGESYKAQNR